MQQQTSEALRAWFQRVESIYPELFNAAHVMCGNYDLAEYALRSAILDVWLENAGSGMGFRERLRSALRQEAFSAALSSGARKAEFTWPGIQMPESEDALMKQISQERVEVQRLLVLRFGCGLSVRSISRLTDASASQIRTAIDRFTARCRRNLPLQDRPRVDALVTQRLRRQLARSTAGIPGPAQVYRAFEAEASGMQVTGHRAARIIGRLLVLVMALACAVMFWLFAVIVQPPAMESPPAAAQALEGDAGPASDAAP